MTVDIRKEIFDRVYSGASRRERDLGVREMIEGAEGLEIIGEALYHGGLLERGYSKDEAMREVMSARTEKSSL